MVSKSCSNPGPQSGFYCQYMFTHSFQMLQIKCTWFTAVGALIGSPCVTLLRSQSAPPDCVHWLTAITVHPCKPVKHLLLTNCCCLKVIQMGVQLTCWLIWFTLYWLKNYQTLLGMIKQYSWWDQSSHTSLNKDI